MKFRTLFLGIILSLVSVTAVAGSGHSHGHGHGHTLVNKAMVEVKATEIVSALVKRDKLEKSWASVKASSVEKKVFKGNSEWVTIFVNDKVTDTSKQKLHIFLTLGGDYIAANFSGE